MSDDWVRLSHARFRPGEVEEITGYSTDLQRRWHERYFGELPDAWWHFPRREENGSTAHRRFTWQGVQMIAVFGDVLKDLKDGNLAKAALLYDTPPNVHRSGDTLSHDFRDRGTGDLFMIYFHDRENDPYFTTTNLANLPGLLGDHWGNRAYLYNLSGMQRRLAKRALPIALQGPVGLRAQGG